ncbi:hypothetical protein [Azonexus sp. R2A61]|uniref:hypothetical protein n=1 Tax=Azonexus sp. R2A61 TaxID=2744443 RepID=UPI001F22796C|nr:hypothetical protein [Azonexus sp. R2A61]
MSVTKEQWAAVENELSGHYGAVELICDGYKVTAQIQTIAKLRQGIVVYVNGVFKGEWIKGEAEEARKFHREMKRYLYPAKKREEFQKMAKNRRYSADFRKDLARMATASVSTWAPYWTNAKAFTRQLRKTCTEIQVVTIHLNGMPS